jgi:hypothetical protein
MLAALPSKSKSLQTLGVSLDDDGRAAKVRLRSHPSNGSLDGLDRDVC